MKRYNNLGTPIEVHINNEYYIVAFINMTNKDKSEYRCDLHIRDKESGFMMDLDKNITLCSDYKKVKVRATEELSKMIYDGYFKDDAINMDKIYECLKLHSDYKEK